MAVPKALAGFTPEQLDAVRAKRREGLSLPELSAWLSASGVDVGRRSLSEWLGGEGVVPEAKAIELAAITPAADLDKARLTAALTDNRKLREANRAMREAADRDRVIAAAIERACTESHDGLTVPEPYTPKRGGKYAPQQFLAHLSDAHYGEYVNPALTHGIEYDREIALNRVAYFGRKIVRYAELRPYKIEVLHLAVLGDMLSGDNHEDLDVTNEGTLAEQMAEMSEALYELLLRLKQSGEFGSIRCTIVRGNHPRAHKVPRHKQPHASWEYGMGLHVKSLVERCMISDVSVVVPQATRHVIEVAGRQVCLTHGDGVKAASFAGIPWYAMKSKRDALQALHHSLGIEPVDQISMGHFHQHIHWPSDCNIVVNGSVKGGDEYVMDTRYAHTPPMQVIQDWHPVKGLASTNYVDLGHVNR